MIYKGYEAVIGLEIHVQLKTKSKAFSADPISFGAKPNTQVNPISLGHPGTLPVLNEAVIEYAVRLGLACGAHITKYNKFARKNYFYADLPKGYQISQYDTPICTGGFIMIKDAEGNDKEIGLTRIHIEEDSGKSIHDLDPFYTLIDLNRAGTPLLEIVSKPDFRNGQEAYNYLSEMRKLVRYLDISDGNMEEGSLRCDVNISVRKQGANGFGTKVEIKNMNSFRNVQKAIDHEIVRQVELLESGQQIEQETRTYDPVSDTTLIMRTKEDAHDYRYFTEPDLAPLVISEEYIEQVKKAMPALPWEIKEKLTKEHNLSEYDALQICENKELAQYYLQAANQSSSYKNIANYLLGPVKSYLNEKGIAINDFPVVPQVLTELIDLVDKGLVSHTMAQTRILPLLIEYPHLSPEQIARDYNLIQERDENFILETAKEILDSMPDKVEQYKAGKKGLLGLFMGELMKKTGGKADPKMASTILQNLLNQ
ncbi:Asp-tRNA(Asn)/Glu-tRNA(Gln) amidotransferase subunit GatB [Schleiferia thermophila]|jgi:aspartyl-tRNA(Asn)/glutamyl-tRNA(Gln) amidotransferase subunit B|uniref:Aspartyl/glutamyl-tRNA(Asn/Gln) amidotransferase subunit B n=1 Tax=Schleiferia thermophila TaxID=884107 RepID=A0A369A461_9FLAO|nr:Asp-tRNA(Asn)/Glu-tRNA(Gln) amidotransferase subunit GatB [Schleiferia thermophila]RCX03188.1 aspartyl/glutamyl-tRNA(Asn/Gln) amidotransferase subunit B [Schleiferia thermophila]GCD80317.1 aspartyl/glutamyl-tRNA(Asn/Gln) amidotransferase subunit B [Schleiferia thermophila]